MISKTLIGGILVLALAYYLSNRNCCKNEGKIIETKSGSVKGIISLSRDGREYYEWLGIPYAKPPVGPLRFATPQPIGKWEGLIDGSSYGNVCAQFDMMTGSIKGEEDCLTLNVHVPKKEQTDKKLLPVLFYIHGGYFVSGSSELFRPGYFMDEDVILITTNYRLAALGFLSTGDALVRGNMGLKDQSMALKWINDNIIHFGGDPKQITIFGESAGATSVHFQILSPMSRGLMKRGISQSGTALSMWTIYEDPLGQAQRFARKLNCPVETTTEMVKCLRNVEIGTLLEVHRETLELKRSKDVYFVPTVETVLDEETFLPDHPTNLVKSGRFEKIPWLSGFNADEGLIFASNVITKPDYRRRLETDWNYMTTVAMFLTDQEKQKSGDKIRQFYFGDRKELDLLSQFKPMTQLVTDRWFGYGHYQAALGHAKFAPIQFYYYNKTGPSLFDILILIEGKYSATFEVLLGFAKRWFNTAILRRPYISYGVCHGDDLAMLTEIKGVFSIPKGDPHYQFSKDLVKTWVDFATLPKIDDVAFRGEKFPRVNLKGELSVLEINDQPKNIKLPILERMKLWESLDQ